MFFEVLECLVSVGCELEVVIFFEDDAVGLSDGFFVVDGEYSAHGVSLLGCFCGGDAYDEFFALCCFWVELYGAVVFVDDALCHGESESHAVFFCGEEGHEDVGYVFGVDSGSGVFDFERAGTVVFVCGDFECSSLGHGFDGVLEDVLDCAVELLCVDFDVGYFV